MFLVLFLYVCSQVFQGLSFNRNCSLLILKESTAIYFLWKQKHKQSLPQCHAFSEFHFTVLMSLKYLAWFNSAVPFTIP